MQILDGRNLSEKILEELKEKKKDRKLKLAVVLVGTNSASKSYITQKQRAFEKVGIDFELFNFSIDISEEELESKVKKISDDKNISGVVIQLPLPEQIDSQKILNLVPEEKDIDVLSEYASSRFFKGESKILPPVVSSISHFLEEYQILLKGKKVVVVGEGRLVGRPVAQWFLNNGCEVLTVNKNTENISSITKAGDIIVSGVGQTKLITGEMVKNGAVVIDAGISVENGSVKGDVDFESVSQKASFITPVPGGVGPLTVACLVENLIKLNG